MDPRARNPFSPHGSVLGEPRTDENRIHLIEASPIGGLYVANPTYVHSTTPCSHGVKTDGDPKIIPKKDVCKSSKNRNQREKL